MATTASVYNTSRTTRQILRRHRKDKPSLILHLHNHHFRFERQNGMFLFDSPVKAFLGYIRDQKVPADLIDVLTESGVQFFEGCLLVEVHDHRSHAAASESILGPRELHSISAAGQGRDVVGGTGAEGSGGLASSLFYLQEGGRYGARKMVGGTGSFDPRTGGLGGVEIYRIVLHPTSETLWADIKMLDDMAGGMWSDQEALEVEAKILALTAPPLCLTPDPQATRIANLMLSSTALPSAYIPSHDSPYRSAKKRNANSIEVEKEEANRQRRDKIMRLMQHGHKRVLPPAQAGMPNALARPGSNTVESGGSTSAAATAFVPTFDRMTFIERWRIGRNAALNGGIPAAPPAGAAANGANAPNGAAAGTTAKGGKDAAKATDKDEAADAANTSTTKKPPSKKKKKAQREKEEAEAAAAAEAAKKKAEEEAAAAAAAAKKPKKKLTKKEREEKERKEKEEKEKAEKEEKERKEKEAAAANGKGSKPKSKKKQKEEAAAAAAAAEAASKSPAKNAKDAPGSPDKDKKSSPKKTAAKKPATAAAATPAASAATPASSKKKTPAKSDKKNAASNTNAVSTAGATNGITDTPTLPNAAVQGTPILGSATPSVQSTPTPAHRAIPSQPQQQQQLQQQQQMQQQLTQQQLQQAALAGMFPNMANQLPFGAAGVSQPGANNGGFGMPMMNGGFPPTSNPQATAAALAAMQGMGLGQFGGAGAGNFGNAAQMQQMMQMMNAGGMVGFNGMPFGAQQGQQGQGQQGQAQQQQGQGQGGDMPVGVGLAGLANWGTGK